MKMEKLFIVKLTKGFNAVVSEEDFEEVSKYKWYAVKMNGSSFYAVGSFKQPDGSYKTVGMHRFIMGQPAGKCVDHKSGNTLDNRTCDLRIASQAENTRNSKLSAANTSGLKGAYENRKTPGRWVSSISVNSKNINLGSFGSAKEAHEAYMAAAVKYSGEFARSH